MVAKEAAKEFPFAKEIHPEFEIGADLMEKCCELSEGNSNEINGLNIYYIYRYILLSLLSHALPRAISRVCRGVSEIIPSHPPRNKNHANMTWINRYFPKSESFWRAGSSYQIRHSCFSRPEHLRNGCNAMNRKEKRELNDCRSLLYPAPCPKPDPDRLLALVQGWWRGRSQADMAAEYGLSQQRVSAILRWVGCTQGLLHKAKRERPDSPRRALRNRIFEAQASLKHAGFERLTIKQRCAVAWQATGLTLVDIATRMAVTPQAVQQFLVGARWR